MWRKEILLLWQVLPLCLAYLVVMKILTMADRQTEVVFPIEQLLTDLQQTEQLVLETIEYVKKVSKGAAAEGKEIAGFSWACG